MLCNEQGLLGVEGQHSECIQAPGQAGVQPTPERHLNLLCLQVAPVDTLSNCWQLISSDKACLKVPGTTVWLDPLATWQSGRLTDQVQSPDTIHAFKWLDCLL